MILSKRRAAALFQLLAVSIDGPGGGAAASSIRGSAPPEQQQQQQLLQQLLAHRKLPPGCANEGQKSATCGATGGSARDSCCADQGLACDASGSGSCVASSGTPSPTASPTPAGTAFVCPPGLVCACAHDASLECATDADCEQTASVMKCTKSPFGECEVDADCDGNGNKCRSGSASVPGTCLAVGTGPPSKAPTKSPTIEPTASANPTLSLKPAGDFAAYPVASAQDISDAMLMAQPGDALLMSTSSAWTNEDIVFRGFGTADSPITLTTDTPGTPVILNGGSKLRISGSHLVVDGLRFDSGALSGGGDQVVQFRTSSSELADRCRLTNTAIINYNPNQSTSDTRWVGLYGTNNVVDHCYFSGKDHQGPLMVVWRRSDGTPDHHRIEHNYFGNFASGGGANGWETIRIGTSATSLSNSSTVVSGNLFERCDGEIEIISVKSGNNVLSGNTFDSCEGMLTLRHGRGNTVDGNFFLGKGVVDSGGVRIIDSDHVVTNNYFEGLRGSSARAAVVLANGLVDSALNEYFPVERATVAFNTIYDCKEAIRIGWRSSSNSVKVADSVISNNAVYSTSAVATTIINEEDAPENMLYEGNFMYGDGVPLGISPVPAGITEADPGLILDASDGLYRPDSGSSPCIDGAVGSYSSVASDMDGQSRSDPKDVGADEVSNDTVTSRPLGASDVGGVIGPDWMSS